MLKLRAVYWYSKNDKEFRSDYLYLQLFVNGILLKEYEDHYHQKGPEEIDGMQRLLKFMNVEFSFEEDRMNDLDWEDYE